MNQPVYTTDNNKTLVYKSEDMILDKPYPVYWEGKHLVLIKREKKVEMYESVE